MTIDDCEDANDTDKNFRVPKLRSFVKELKKLRRQLQRKRHIKIELIIRQENRSNWKTTPLKAGLRAKITNSDYIFIHRTRNKSNSPAKDECSCKYAHVHRPEHIEELEQRRRALTI